MKLLIGLMFVASNVFGSDFYRDVKLYSNNNVEIVNIYNDTTMSGTQDFSGKILNIYATISGTCTLTNAIIVAVPFIQIFDTTVTIGTGIQCERFSAMWFGAKPSLADNSRQLQYSINASINKAWLWYLPTGVFKTKDSLIVKTGDYGSYEQSTIHMYGDASFWGDGGSQILYSGDFCALGLQLNKGSTVRNIILKGKWASPTSTGSTYYSLPLIDYTNTGTGGNGNGLWIDPFGDWNQRSGSTGCKFTDMQVKNFMTDIKISNSISQNGEIMIFDNIQLGDAKYGILTSQPQEKANVFRGIYSWGKIHTLFTIRNGNYYIEGGNVAGSCIRLFDIQNESWFPTHIKDFYAEQFGTIGTISSNLPSSVQNCVFDFAYQSLAGVQTLLTADNNFIKFDNCQFRYYGQSQDFNFSGTSTFENCLFTSVVNGLSNSVFVKYANGVVDYNASQVIQRSDTVSQPSSVKISLRKSY